MRLAVLRAACRSSLSTPLRLAPPAAAMHCAVLRAACNSGLGAPLLLAPPAATMSDAVLRAAFRSLGAARLLTPPAAAMRHTVVRAAFRPLAAPLLLARPPAHSHPGSARPKPQVVCPKPQVGSFMYTARTQGHLIQQTTYSLAICGILPTRESLMRERVSVGPVPVTYARGGVSVTDVPHYTLPQIPLVKWYASASGYPRTLETTLSVRGCAEGSSAPSGCGCPPS